MAIFSFSEISANLEVLYGPITGMEESLLRLGEEIFRCEVDDLFEHGGFIDFGDLDEVLVLRLPVACVVKILFWFW